MAGSSQSEPVADAGCVATLDETAAGCAESLSEASQANALLRAASDGAGCAAPAPADESDATATPPQTVREFERALRGLGFTRPQATHIARHGFNTATAPEAPAQEPAPDKSEHLQRAMQRLLRSMKATP